MTNTMLDLVNDLRQYDHAFISGEGVDHFAKAFGVQVKASRVKATPNEMKGLTLNDGARSAVGMDAATSSENNLSPAWRCIRRELRAWFATAGVLRRVGSAFYENE